MDIASLAHTCFTLAVDYSSRVVSQLPYVNEASNVALRVFETITNSTSSSIELSGYHIYTPSGKELLMISLLIPSIFLIVKFTLYHDRALAIALQNHPNGLGRVGMFLDHMEDRHVGRILHQLEEGPLFRPLEAEQRETPAPTTAPAG
jgi:hypothetical protein